MKEIGEESKKDNSGINCQDLRDYIYWYKKRVGFTGSESILDESHFRTPSVHFIECGH